MHMHICTSEQYNIPFEQIVSSVSDICVFGGTNWQMTELKFFCELLL